MKFKLAYLILFTLLLPGLTVAQTPENSQSATSSEQINDEELKQYLLATYRAQSIYNEDNSKMADTLRNHGLDVDQYNQILNAMKTGEPIDESEASDDEIEKFRKVSHRINQMQESMERQIVEAIESNGIELNRFDEIFEMIQREPALRVRVETLMKNMDEWKN